MLLAETKALDQGQENRREEKEQKEPGLSLSLTPKVIYLHAILLKKTKTFIVT